MLAITALSPARSRVARKEQRPWLLYVHLVIEASPSGDMVVSPGMAPTGPLLLEAPQDHQNATVIQALSQNLRD